MNTQPEVTIIVEFPGYWAHGKTFQATREVLQVRTGAPAQAEHRKYSWALEETDDPCVLNCDTYVIRDKDGNPWGIPANRAREIQ